MSKQTGSRSKGRGKKAHNTILATYDLRGQHNTRGVIAGSASVMRWDKENSVVQVGNRAVPRSHYGFKLYLACEDGWEYLVTEWGYMQQSGASVVLMDTMRRLDEAYSLSVTRKGKEISDGYKGEVGDGNEGGNDDKGDSIVGEFRVIEEDRGDGLEGAALAQPVAQGNLS